MAREYFADSFALSPDAQGFVNRLRLLPELRHLAGHDIVTVASQIEPRLHGRGRHEGVAFCAAPGNGYPARNVSRYPFQHQAMPLDERCKGWTKREDA